MRSLARRSPALVIAVVLMMVGSSASTALAAGGGFKGLLHDQLGRPLSDVLVALVGLSSPLSLPILSRTDDSGRIHFSNVEPGEYALVVRSSRYKDGETGRVRILSSETSIARFVLQQLLPFGGTDENNVSVKTLLRSSQEGRLIFRNLPGSPGQAAGDGFEAPFQRDAVVQFVSGAGLEEDHLVFPGDASGGSTTNFALAQRLVGDAGYVLAGQLNQGEDTLWRLKNVVRLPMSDGHSLEAFVGYGRMSFDQPPLAVLDNPMSLGDNPDYTRISGTTKTLAVGLQESLILGEAVSLILGLELDRVQADRVYNFLNPNAEVTLFPEGKTTVHVMVASKRSTRTGSLNLPGGDVINLNDAVYLSRGEDQFRVGTSRYYRTSVTRELDEDSEIEVTVFRNRPFSGATPFLAVMDGEPDVHIFHLDDRLAGTSGYQLAVSRRFGSTIHTSLSYASGSAAGISSDPPLESAHPESVMSLVDRRQFHEISTELEAYIPSSRTRLNAVVKFFPRGNPITSLDTFSDDYEVGTKGINLFVRQVVPVPTDWLTFLGLDFLSDYRIEALLDVRNLANQDLARVQTGEGEIALKRNPRSVRGGISVRF